MKILLMRGVELAKRQTKVKTLQNCSTKALVATVGHFKEKFVWGLHSSIEMAGRASEQGAGRQRSRGAGEQGSRGRINTDSARGKP
jgi:hypothetical protein